MRTPPTPRSFTRIALATSVAAALFTAHAHDANAQVAGTTEKALPNVLLLVDNSGSMERMNNNGMPTCTPGATTTPNRWGVVLQALTGNFQPGYSCLAEPRTDPTKQTTSMYPGVSDLTTLSPNYTMFKNEYQINGVLPYDAQSGGYFLPYHRPLTGTGTSGACALAPYLMPGASNGANGVGPGKLGAGGDAGDFPTTALASVYYSHLLSKYSSGSGSAITPAVTGASCTFDQANDGQLDAVQDFVRFALMTFDTDPNASIGVTTATPPSGNVATDPFTGMWSYVATSPFTLSTGVSGTDVNLASGSPLGNPYGCGTSSVFEVGARHAAAPPWEGRLVKFPSPGGTLLDIEASNAQLQQVLLATRPYGATPLDGMFYDARDYLLGGSAAGPSASSGATSDAFVKGGCRDQYIILLSDGAPNMAMRDVDKNGHQSCGNWGTPSGSCPYKQEAWSVAKDLYGSSSSPTGTRVTTYVIGFSVNGSSGLAAPDGFPSGVPQNCKGWYDDTSANGGHSNAKTMDDVCSAKAAPGSAAWEGSTAQACCQLNKIAFNGTGADATLSTGAYFAESQSDVVLAFSRILAAITKTASTRTVPASSPVMSVAGSQTTAQYVASFVPNARKVWSGEIDRTRSKCVTTAGGSGSTATTTAIAADPDFGDLYSINTATQAVTGKRFFMTVLPEKVTSGTGTAVDAQRTIRPYDETTDGAPLYGGMEIADLDNALITSSTTQADLTTAMQITGSTCKKSKSISSVDVPALTTPSDCAEVMWDFAVAHPGTITKAGYSGFNVRCATTDASADFSTGTCSVSGQPCSMASSTACTGVNTVPGEVCVPACSALGAVFRSSPAVLGPPVSFLREDGFRGYQQDRATRRAAMFVATTDGILHAFKALPEGNTKDTAGPAINYELWAFVPPAVLPKLASNYPGGQQILLDGSPVVKEMVWDRTNTDVNNDNLWHTTLVAGMGAGGGGYYALNVSDVDCGGTANATGCQDSSKGWERPVTTATHNAANLGKACVGGVTSKGCIPGSTDTPKRGPHFLWQLTDIEGSTDSGSPEVASTTRVDPIDATKNMVALFGKQSGTPAITTLQIVDSSSIEHQIGVAILPGGIDGAASTSAAGCDRAYLGGSFNATYNLSHETPRAKIRQWGKTCTSPVAGRGVTIVRLDNGQIIKHFGRVGVDVPTKLNSVTINSPFDSPIIGQPVVYPNQLGVVAQKIYVGDADGTLWRIDVSSTNPDNWKAALLHDVALNASGTPLDSQPIALQPVVSQNNSGNLVINAATGDQENIIPSSQSNWVVSVEEVGPTSATDATLRWSLALTNGERVTGPMTVFDRTLYFATYKPDTTTSVCAGDAAAYLWGMDFVTPKDSADLTKAGLDRWCTTPSASGTCAAAFTQKEAAKDDSTGNAIKQIIPGVTVHATQPCAAVDSSVGDDLSNGIAAIQTTSYELFFGYTGARSSGSPKTAQAGRSPKKIPAPRVSTSVDAWAFVVE